MQLETVKVAAEVTEENPHGYVVINKSDFDEKVHELFEEKADKSPDKMSVPELKAFLAEKGVQIPEGAKKGDLLALVPKE